MDHITRDPAWPAHLPLVRMGGEEPGQRMGEYVALACLSLLRDWRRVALSQAAARWEDHQSGRCAPDVTVGVMGLGNLGARAAAMLTGLGFPVVGWARSRKAVPGVTCFAGEGERDAFLARADILVCLLPDTPDTRGAIRAETIALLPPGAAVVNAARGPHVVLDDLLAALDSGRLSGAVLDVFDEEPLPPGHAAWSPPEGDGDAASGEHGEPPRPRPLRGRRDPAIRGRRGAAEPVRPGARLLRLATRAARATSVT